MSETLSPQGYIISKDPKNNNPFWDSETEGSNYKTTIQPLVTNGFIMNVQREDENYNSYWDTTFNGELMYSEGNYSLSGAGTINSYTKLSSSNDYTKLAYNYYKFLKNHPNYKFANIRNGFWYKFYDIVNNTDNKYLLNSEALEAYNSALADIPTEVKCLDSIVKIEYNSNDYWFHILTPYIERIDKEGNYTLTTGYNIITEDV